MIRYTVVWTQSARAELAEIWMAAKDRAAVTSAADTIDAELANGGERKGVEVSEGLRALSIPPLRVLFVVTIDDRVAQVLRVRRT